MFVTRDADARHGPRMSLLALGPQEVCPPTDGGKEGIHGALRAIARIADVVYAYPASPTSATSTAAYAAIGVTHVPVGYQPRETPAGIVAATARLKPYKFAKYSTTTAITRFDAAIGPRSFDAIMCFHAHTEELGQRLRRRRGWNIPLLVREHNIEYELVASYRHTCLSAPARSLAWPFEVLTRRTERRMWTRADAVAFLSDRDLATARATGVRGNLLLAPEGIPIPPIRLAERPASRPQLLVPLNPRAAQSVANLKQFLSTHWYPASQRSSLASVSLAVTGVNLAHLAQLVGTPPESLKHMRVQALGFLPSLAPAFATSLAVVSPTFTGGGIRKKILEGMANQVPVIATDMDIDTCSYFDPPRNILRLGSPDEFAATVVTLLQDVETWNALAADGRATVEKHAAWDQFASIVIDELARLAEARRRHSLSP